MCLLLGSSKFRESILRKCPQRGRLCVQDSPAALFTIVRKCWAPGTEGKLQFSHQRAVPKPLKVTLSDNMSESLWKNGKWAKKKVPNYLSIQITNVTKGKTDAEKKNLKRNKKKSKQWLYFNGSRALGPTPHSRKGLVLHSGRRPPRHIPAEQRQEVGLHLFEIWKK